MEIQVGSKVPLLTQLFDYEPGKYIQAVVKDDTDTPVAGSPFNLAHIANGFYRNFSLLMPDVQFISVQYLVYDDSGHTTLTEDYAATCELFFRALSSGGGGSDGVVDGNSEAISDESEGVAETDAQDSFAETDELETNI